MRKKIEPKWIPREVDSFLQKKYALSLYHFTFSLDDVFSIRNKRTIKIKESQHLELSWRDFWLERIKDLEKLKQYNKESRKILNRFLEKTDFYLKSFHDGISQIWQEQGKNLKINDISQPLDELITYIKEFFLSPTKKRGVSPKETSILFLVWSHFLKDNKNAHTVVILSLLKWFSNRVGKSELEEEDFFEQNYRKELNRYRKAKLKSLSYIIDIYKKRFSVPIRHNWLELSINSALESNVPLIVFSNGERLTSDDCLLNNVSYKKFLSDEYRHLFFGSFDFRESKCDETVEFDESEEEIVDRIGLALTDETENKRNKG